ncbi:glutathione binding-like protein [Ottowia sp. VDI28]|uniref:glutathione binding-like protein n=1 Tax=Ottowia sp. VDI28 TaxID=3133968 RepID=UPI003C301239
MIDAYSWPTPNGYKVHIMLEETGLPYRVHAVNIRAGDQFKPEFLAISPNNRIPAIMDSEGPEGEPVSLFESGAILIYLAEKTGKLMPRAAQARYEVLQWLMWQMGGFGPMLGQAHHFMNYAPEKLPYAIDRYANEARRLYGVLDKRLSNEDFVAGGEYSIADIAIFSWARAHTSHKIDLAAYPHVARWYAQVLERPAVARGLQVLAERRPQGAHDPEQWKNLFGATQFEKR